MINEMRGPIGKGVEASNEPCSSKTNVPWGPVIHLSMSIPLSPRNVAQTANEMCHIHRPERKSQTITCLKMVF